MRIIRNFFVVEQKFGDSNHSNRKCLSLDGNEKKKDFALIEEKSARGFVELKVLSFKKISYSLSLTKSVKRFKRTNTHNLLISKHLLLLS